MARLSAHSDLHVKKAIAAHTSLYVADVCRRAAGNADAGQQRLLAMLHQMLDKMNRNQTEVEEWASKLTNKMNECVNNARIALNDALRAL